jgi:predicted ATPase
MRIVITGGPCTGKTSLIDYIGNHGVFVIPEVARPIVAVMQEYEPEKFENKSCLEDIIDTLQIKAWKDHPVGIFDRGLPDQIAYRHYFGVKIPSSLHLVCDILRYEKVFFLPFWKEIYVNNEVRAEPEEDAQLLSRLIYRAYRDYGYELIEVPKVSIEQRVEFIMDNI